MSEQTLLYGIGAAKAGTSWLHRYLSGHPECHFRSLKELHYFNTLSGQGKDWPRLYRERRLQAIGNRLATRGDFSDRDRIVRLKADIEEWHRVFDGKHRNDAGYLAFLKSQAENARVIADITPAYATLAARDFARMSKIAPSTKFIYILRDPVSRLWSNVRMTAKRAALKGADALQVASDQVENYLAGKNASLARRSDYRGTLEKLQNAVPASDVLVEFFENLFTKNTMRRITDFLNISAHDADLGEPVHKGRSLKMTQEQWQKLRAALAPQYDFVQAMFPGRVPTGWLQTGAHARIAG